MSTDYRHQLAGAAGYTGAKADVFADLLVGETEQELTEHTARLVELGKGLAPPPVSATDPTQGLGGGDRGRPNYGELWMVKRMDNVMERGRDPWVTTLGW